MRAIPLQATIQKLVSVKLVVWIRAAMYAVLLVMVYYSALRQMILHDWLKEDYSHCFIIPFVVLYLIWEKREAPTETPFSPSWKGLAPFFIGIFLFWLGELGGEYFTLYLSFWFIIVGLVWLHFGWGKIKAIWFALVMMLAMFPFPNFVNVRISFALKLISSKLGVWMLQLEGMSAHREGNIIDLGFTQLQMVDACSGLRYIFPLIILSLLIAYFYKEALWKRAIIVISSIPLSIITNSLRIAITGILYEVWGARVAEGFFYGFSGWLIFIISLGILLVEMWGLKKIGGKGLKVKGETAVSKNKIHISLPLSFEIKRSKGFGAFLYPVQFIVGVTILSATLALSQGTEFREKIPIKKPLSELPLTIGEWTGNRDQMEQRFIDALDFSDYVIIDYTDKGDKHVNFYVAYYESQRKGESIHSPETCLPGSGWEFREAGFEMVPLIRGNPGHIKVNRAFMVKIGMKEFPYFWFPQRGRILNNAYQLKIYTFWDALTRHRTDGALVRVITPVYPDEQLQDAEARLQGFTREIAPILSKFIPD